MLGVINESLGQLLLLQRKPLSAEERLELFKKDYPDVPFTRKDYLNKYKDISAPTASRDLKDAVEKRILIKKGDKRTASYHFRNFH